MILLKNNDFKQLFKIESSSLKNPINKEISLMGDKTPNQKSRASYLLLVMYFKKQEKNPVGVSKKDIEILKEEANKEGFHCKYCQKKFKNEASVDHIHPKYFGGHNFFDNIQIICQSCNYKKGALNSEKTPEAFSLFLKKTKDKNISSLDIINESLGLRGISSQELKNLIKLKIVEERWREDRKTKKEKKNMSAKVLQFKPRPDNRIYFPEKNKDAIEKNNYSSNNLVFLDSVKKWKHPVKNEISYQEYLKMNQERASSQEEKELESLNYFYDKQYNCYYLKDDDGFSCELIEKRNGVFFYLEILPFNMFPSRYVQLKNLEEVRDFLKSLAG